jgi:hypothetical protein
MSYYLNWGWFSRPQDLLQNEWVLFGVVFLICFAMIYLALSNFFFREKRKTLADVLMGIKDKSSAKGPVVVISFALSLLISMSLTQSDYLQAYLGAGAAVGILIFSVIVFAILTLPFYVALEHNFSSKFAGPLFGLIVWVVLKFLFPQISYDLIWRMPYEWQGFYEGLVSGFGLFILLLAGFVLGLMRGKRGG